MPLHNISQHLCSVFEQVRIPNFIPILLSGIQLKSASLHISNKLWRGRKHASSRWLAIMIIAFSGILVEMPGAHLSEAIFLLKQVIFFKQLLLTFLIH